MCIYIYICFAPLALPLDAGKLHLDSLTPCQRLSEFNDAAALANNILQVHKIRTGVAILGKPVAALVSDPKVQNKVLAASIGVGEVFALASLTSELFVIRAAGIPSADFPKYIGRGQYLRFQRQSPFSPQNDAEPDKTYFTCIHNIVNKTKLFKSQNTTCIPQSTAIIIQAWTSTYVANIIKHNQVDPNRDPAARVITVCGLTIAQ